MFSDDINSYKIVLLDDNILFVEGIKKILSITDENCMIELKKKLLKIDGKQLKVCELNASEMKIKGKVQSITLESRQGDKIES